jgi:hypothetical protein
MRQFFIGFLIVAALLVGGSVVANIAYQAGLQTAVTTVAATAPEGTIVTPVVPGVVPGYGYGYGYGPGWGWHGGGFSIFGFLFGLFILFLLFGLIRAAFGRGRGWGGGRGWSGPGYWGPGGHDHTGERPWERQAREVHDAWHRDANGQSGSAGGNPPTDRPTTGSSSS